MPGIKRRSLFWTFAGAFLVVLVGAAVLQIVVVAAVLRPLATRDLQHQAAPLMVEAAAGLAELEGTDQEIREEIIRVMSGLLERGPGPFFILFEDSEGGRILGRPTRGGPGRQKGVRPDLNRPPRFGARERQSDDMEELLRRPVRTAGGRTGELVAVAPRPRLPFRLPGGRSHILLFIPLSMLIAGFAGAVLFRHLTKRIQGLEALAGQVAAGDLDARIDDPRGDEIGRLGASLNRMTEHLARGRDEIKATEKQRRQLLADISHELATPLTSIRGYAETLSNPAVPVSDTEQADYLKNIVEEAERMNFLINDLLELARLESGAIELERERLDLASLCQHTVSRFASRYRDAGVHLSWAPAGESHWVRADGRRLEQVMDNLLVNSLRYVPRGGTVSVSVTRPGKGGRVSLVVTDNGPGVPPEHLPHLFDRFYRADDARATGGTGLGLAIVKEIVERHEGAVRAEPVVPHGLTLQIDLPESIA